MSIMPEKPTGTIISLILVIIVVVVLFIYGFTHPTNEYQEGLADGINGTYNPPFGDFGINPYRDGFQTGYISSHCSCNCSDGVQK